MISQTWPQYLRRQCTVIASLSEQENELLSTLLLRRPAPIAVNELIEAIYPNPDFEPESAAKNIAALVDRLGQKIGRAHISAAGWGRGYRLEIPSKDRT